MHTVVVVTGAGAGGTYTVVGGGVAVVGAGAGAGVAGRVVVGTPALARPGGATVLVGVGEVGLCEAVLGVVTVGLVDLTLLGAIVTAVIAAERASPATWLTITPDANPAPRNSVCEIRLERSKR